VLVEPLNWNDAWTLTVIDCYLLAIFLFKERVHF